MKYLIPLDASRTPLAALDQLERAARRGEAVEAVLLNVQPRFNRHIAQFTREIHRDALRAERSRDAMEPAARRLTQAGIPFRMIAEIGDRAERIAAVARTEGIDRILAGDTRRRSLERYLIPAGVAGLAALILAAE